MNNSSSSGLFRTSRPSDSTAPAPSIIRPPKILLSLIEDADDVTDEKQHNVNTTTNGNGNGNGHGNKEELVTKAPPSPLPRKRSAHSSLLSDLLTDNSSDLLPYVLQFSASDCTYPDESNKYKSKTRVAAAPDAEDHQIKMAKLALNDHDHSTTPFLSQHQHGGMPSRTFSDYFVVQFESTRQLEQAGAENSLFLLIARALLYKLNFVADEGGYEAVLRNQIFQDLVPKDYRFDSDMSLQELIRKRLCLHWLSNVRGGKFVKKEACKYYKHFGNVYDFVFQAYQISISNFTHNTLFRQFALQDLAELFHCKLQVFHKLSPRHINDNNFKITVYEPAAKSAKVNGSHNVDSDFICMLNDESDPVKYKWLMPVKSKTPLFNERFLTSSFRVSELAKRRGGANKAKASSKHFLKVSSLYTHHMFVVNSSEIYKCFVESQSHQRRQDDGAIAMNHMIFAFFLKEAPVQTVMMYNKRELLSFGDILARNDPAHTVRCLNSLWGKPHFQLNELLGRLTPHSTATMSQQQQQQQHQNKIDDSDQERPENASPWLPTPISQSSPEKARSSNESTPVAVVKRKSSSSDNDDGDDGDYWRQTSQLVASCCSDGQDDHSLNLNNAFSSSGEGANKQLSWFDTNIKSRRFLAQFSSLRPAQKKKTMAVQKNELENSPMDLENGAPTATDQQAAAAVPCPQVNKSKRKKYMVKKIISSSETTSSDTGGQPNKSSPAPSVLNSCLTTLLALRNKANWTLDSIL